MAVAEQEPLVYQGQFGEFTITDGDRREVVIYRAGLLVAALCFALGVGLMWMAPGNTATPTLLTLLYSGFTIALGTSLWFIHIYLKPLHQALQGFWVIGTIAAIAFSVIYQTSLALVVIEHPWSLLGIGFTFAALTGIFFKEAFCFNRLETKLLTPLVPVILLGHLAMILSVTLERRLLLTWAILFLVFAGRKLIQPIPDDIGDKSVFAYLHQQAQQDRAGA